MKWSTSHHRPPHLYVDDAWYFVTASTANKKHVLSSDEHFDLWVTIFKELIAEFKLKLTAWVLLPNHYHFLFLPKLGYDLSPFMKHLNGRTSHELNSLDQKRGRKVWYSYWDTCSGLKSAFRRISVTGVKICFPSSMALHLLSRGAREILQAVSQAEKLAHIAPFFTLISSDYSY